MFVSQHVCLISYTLLYFISFLHSECYGFHIPDYADPNYTSRIKRESCGFRCVNGECISGQEKCDGKFDCSDKSDESPELCGGTPNIECGNLAPQTATLILGGENSKKVTYPWHVGVYKLNNINQYEQNCGGSIISRKVIVSAAHCFSNYANGALYDAKQYAIAAGKYYRNYYDERDTLSQTSIVKQIIIPDQYKGLLTRFKGDIAFVILDKALELTAVVQPVCIDWDNQYEAAQLKENNTGTIVGWGATDASSGPKAELKELTVPFVNRETCYNALPESFVRFLTDDKFCAGYTNGTSVCHGDGGSGLPFLRPDNKKYYLRGLVSVGPLKEGMCDFEQYTAYTKVSNYMEMLRAAELTTKV